MRLDQLSDDLPELKFTHFGPVSDHRPDMLSFAGNEGYVRTAINNSDISIVLCDRRLVPEVSERNDTVLVPVEEPRNRFFEIFDRAVRDSGYGVQLERSVSPDVRIGAGSLIGENVVIEPEVTIGRGCVISGGTILRRGVRIDDLVMIGSEGLQTFTVNDVRRNVAHAGGVEVGEFCHLFSHVNVSRALYAENTGIGARSFVSIGTSIGHGSRLGDGVQIAGKCIVGGTCRIEDGVQIGPGVSIADNLRIGRHARIRIGSVVVSDVADGADLSGAFARDHVSVMREHAERRFADRRRKP